MNSSKRKTIFLDRDGTLIEEVNFLSRVEDLRLFSFTKEAVGILKAAGFQLIVITNQSGIARGLYDEHAMHLIHQEIQRELDNAIDAFYFCPHLPDEGCECRKPKLQMLLDADSDLGVDYSASWLIGDKKLDVETGYNAEIRTAMVETGYGKTDSISLARKPDILAANLLEAARQIISFH